MLDESSVLEPLRPLFPSLVAWWRRAFNDYQVKFPLEEQIILGSIHRAGFIQRRVLHHMRTDPMVAGRFRPGDREGREFLLFDGMPFSIAILFRKVTDYAGRRRTSRNGTEIEGEALDGQLLLGGLATIPLVCGYTLAENMDSTSYLTGILIGSENRLGLEWEHHLWRRDAGEDSGQLLEPVSPFPIFPPTRIVLIKPIPAKAPDVTAFGTNVDQRKEQERRRREEERKDGRA